MAIKIRPLKSADLKSKSGFWDTLDNLVFGKKVRYSQALRAYNRVKKQGGHVFVAVDSASGQVVGATTLLVEQKFIRGLALAGHIEDVVTRKGFEGQGVASQLITAALKKAKALGCYKIILDCHKDLVGFYKKFDFQAVGVQMKIYFKIGRASCRERVYVLV